ncbi:MAG: peroxiredoxin [Magnetococcales bacterium]|nr:peroxiredoxin [Magnetococcales bacterium]
MLDIGQPIPDLTLPDQSGQTHPLPQLLGSQGAIFYFYPKDNTPGCTVEANDFQAYLSDFAALGYRVIGLSKDSVASHEKFCQKQNLTFTLLSDADGAACLAFGVWQEKKNYGKVSMGIVRSTFVVDAQGIVRRVYRAVRVNGHAQQLLADLQAR